MGITDGSEVCSLCGEWRTSCSLCGVAPMIRRPKEDYIGATWEDKLETGKQNRSIRSATERADFK